MPSKNTRDRSRRGPSHVYNRARKGRALFRSDADREFFVELIATRVGRSKFRSPRHRRAARVVGAEVSAMCLMTSHFHLIIWQNDDEAMRRLMHLLFAHQRAGTKWAREERTACVRWATAYVHANHPSGLDYRFSTHAAYIDAHRRPGWLSVDRTLAAFGGEDAYAAFMQDHATRAELNARFF